MISSETEKLLWNSASREKPCLKPGFGNRELSFIAFTVALGKKSLNEILLKRNSKISDNSWVMSHCLKGA